ncbi:hypothetical protein C7375_107116 [Frischella perrara]|uniref:Uncharacterized protein n=1 Tax=Frischella perrara TaxID=1267021 RepID=A0A0A7S3D7_FRIPE|nr:hypothetical protein FPB0191_02190 [Frischella perrara]PWV61369.1 hypothetical protein C7375_107116 [Frischella perrara]
MNNFDLSQPQIIPYLEELIKSVDITQIESETKDNLFIHNLKLTDELPRWMITVKNKYR